MKYKFPTLSHKNTNTIIRSEPEMTPHQKLDAVVNRELVVGWDEENDYGYSGATVGFATDITVSSSENEAEERITIFDPVTGTRYSYKHATAVSCKWLPEVICRRKVVGLDSEKDYYSICKIVGISPDFKQFKCLSRNGGEFYIVNPEDMKFIGAIEFGISEEEVKDGDKV